MGASTYPGLHSDGRSSLALGALSLSLSLSLDLSSLCFCFPPRLLHAFQAWYSETAGCRLAHRSQGQRLQSPRRRAADVLQEFMVALSILRHPLQTHCFPTQATQATLTNMGMCVHGGTQIKHWWFCFCSNKNTHTHTPKSSWGPHWRHPKVRRIEVQAIGDTSHGLELNWTAYLEINSRLRTSNYRYANVQKHQRPNGSISEKYGKSVMPEAMYSIEANY